MAVDLKQRVGELLKMSAEELKVALPGVVDEVRQYGIEEALEETPDLMERILRRLVEVDLAKFAREAPEAMNKFMEVVWEGASIVAEKSQDLRASLESVGDINVSLDASDSPFKCHFGIRSGRVSGGPGLWRWKDQDFRYLGPTKPLVDILLGDIEFRQAMRLLPNAPDIDFEGHPMWMPKLTPLMGQVVPRLIRGK